MKRAMRLPATVASRIGTRAAFSTTFRTRLKDGSILNHGQQDSQSQSSSTGLKPSIDRSSSQDTRSASATPTPESLLSRQRTISDCFHPSHLQLLRESLQDYLGSHNITKADDRFSEAWDKASQRPYLVPLGAFQAHFGNGDHSINSFTSDGGEAFHYPGPPFERRVWAGGSIQFDYHSYFRLAKSNRVDKGTVYSKALTCLETISGVEAKGPANAPKLLVQVERVYNSTRDPNAAIIERRDLVFMPPKSAEEARLDIAAEDRVIKPPLESDFEIAFSPQQHLLTTFSCLTFNCHRIHIDRGYAASEGYRNTLVHGPLSLCMILNVLQMLAGKGFYVQGFEYRNLAPLFCDEKMTICVKRGDTFVDRENWSVWITGKKGGFAVKGTAVIAANEGKAVGPKPKVEAEGPKISKFLH